MSTLWGMLIVLLPKISEMSLCTGELTPEGDCLGNKVFYKGQEANYEPVGLVIQFKRRVPKG